MTVYEMSDDDKLAIGGLIGDRVIPGLGFASCTMTLEDIIERAGFTRPGLIELNIEMRMNRLASCPHGEPDCRFGSGACDCAR